MMRPNRREFLTAVTATSLLPLPSMAATSEELLFTSFDHVAISVDSVPKSVAFYSRLFGGAILKAKSSSRRFLKLGPAYMAIAEPESGQASHRVDHIAAGI